MEQWMAPFLTLYAPHSVALDSWSCHLGLQDHFTYQ